jgi:3-hydroxybutyryl-CoA dehydrogenase
MTALTIGLAGLGFMGRGISACLLGYGHRVIVFTPAAQEAELARRHIARCIDEMIEHGLAPAHRRDDWPERFTVASSLEPLAPCDLFIESIIEDLPAKKALLAEVEPLVGEEVVMASNTSALPITMLQQGLKRPQRVLGMHFCEPVHSLRFMEVVRGEQTSDEAVSLAVRFGRSVGKEPAVAQKDVEGFLVNRLAYALYREAFHLVESGVADVETIDRACRNVLGLWSTIAGPFRWMDLTGVPAYARVMERLFPALSTSQEVPATIREVVESGGTGIGNGRGFYSYTPEEAKRWRELFDKHSWRVRELMDEYYPLEHDASDQ